MQWSEESLVACLTQLQSFKETGERWLEGVPAEVRAAFFDNPYVEQLHRKNTFLIESLFGAYQEDVLFFLESPAPWVVETQKGSYTMQSVQEFAKYLIQEGLGQ